MLNEELAKDVKEEVAKPVIRIVWRCVVKPTGKKLIGVLEFAAKVPFKYAANRIRNPRGKMTVKQLLRKDEGAQTVDIDELGLRDFKRIANKHGVDFAIMKSKYIDPPKYTVFFKARDRDALQHVVEEYTAKMLKVKEKPSVLEHLKELKEKVASMPKKVVEKMKEAVR